MLVFVAIITAVAGIAGHLIFTSSEAEIWQPLSGDAPFLRQPDSPGLRASQLAGATAFLIGSFALAAVTWKTRRRAEKELVRG